MNNKISDAEDQTTEQRSRREFMLKAAYASPVLLTLPAMPSFAQQGSGASPPDDGDPGGGDPGGGSGEIDCGNPLEPIDSDVAENMCRLVQDPVTLEISVQDIIVGNDDVEAELAQGSLRGTCASFFCDGS